MTKEAIKEAIFRAINHSNFQVDFIDNDDDGSLVIKVSKPTKYNYYRTITGKIRAEEDIGKFEKVLLEQVN